MECMFAANLKNSWKAGLDGRGRKPSCPPLREDSWQILLLERLGRGDEVGEGEEFWQISTAISGSFKDIVVQAEDSLKEVKQRSARALRASGRASGVPAAAGPSTRRSRSSSATSSIVALDDSDESEVALSARLFPPLNLHPACQWTSVQGFAVCARVASCSVMMGGLRAVNTTNWKWLISSEGSPNGKK